MTFRRKNTKNPSQYTHTSIIALESEYGLTSKMIAEWMGMTAGALRARLSNMTILCLTEDEKKGFWEGLHRWIDTDIHTIRMNVDKQDTRICDPRCGCGERFVKRCWNHYYKSGHRK